MYACLCNCGVRFGAPPPHGNEALAHDAPAIEEFVEPTAKLLADYLASCATAPLVVLQNVDGEVFPCGCSDGQTGGLVSVLPKLRSLNAQAILSLGDNCSPRFIRGDTPHKAYYQARLGFVEGLLSSAADTMHLFSPCEQQLRNDAGTSSPASASRTWMVGDCELSVVVARADTLVEWQTQSSAARSPNQLRLLILSGESADLKADVAEFDRVLWFSRPGAQALPGNAMIHEPPLPGGRAIVVVTVYVPSGWTMADGVVSRGEVDILQRALERSASASHSDLNNRLKGRAEKLLLARPAVVGVDYITLDVRDQVDVQVLQGYTAFLARHGRPVVATDSEHGQGGSACVGCHEGFVTAFKHDLHTNAYKTLEKAGKHGDPFCVTCHTTPSESAKRSKDEVSSSLKAGVQCEWCHTGHEAHVRSPLKCKPLIPDTTLCVQCHNANQSPHYSWNKYVKKLTCYQTKQSERK